MDGFRLRRESVLWLAIGLSGALLRLAALAWPPLNNTEAAEALAAAARTTFASPFWGTAGGASAAYQSLTAWLFQLLGASDWLARCVPALAGALTVFLPLGLRHRLGSTRALVLGALLAWSPALWAVARTAGGTSLAVLGVGALIVSALQHNETAHSSRRSAWMGAAAGLALASGPQALTGLIGLGLGCAWWRWRTPPGRGEAGGQVVAWPIFGVALGASFLALATQFGTQLGGLATAIQMPGQWLATWVGSSQLSLAPAVVMLGVYEPFVTLFGLAGVALARPSGDRIWTAAAVWSGASLALFWLRPGRSAEDLVWVVLPLSVLACLAISRLLDILTDGLEDRSVYLMALALAVLGGFGYLQLTTLANNPDLSGSPQVIQLGFVFTALGFAVALFVLYGVIWSWGEAIHASGAAFGLITFLLAFSAGWRLTLGPEAAGGTELWRPQASSPDLSLLETTLHGVAAQTSGEVNDLAIRLDVTPPPSLAWVLRSFTPAEARVGDPTPPKAILLPKTDTAPSLPGPYLGQSFAVENVWAWDGPLPPDGLKWWLLRKAPSQALDWVLYVQADQPVEGENGAGGPGQPPS